MARKSKVRKPRARCDRNGTKRIKSLVVFCVEGKTEESYIKALRKFRYNDEIAFHFINERGTSLKNLVEACRRAAKNRDLRGGSACWIVCDVDRNKGYFDALDKWLQETKNRIALSTPCLEYWLLLHFVDSPNCSTAARALDELRQHWPEYKKGLDPSKGFEKIVEKTEDAVSRERTRQRSMDRDPKAWPDGPGSQMPTLIEWLDELAKESAKPEEPQG